MEKRNSCVHVEKLRLGVARCLNPRNSFSAAPLRLPSSPFLKEWFQSSVSFPLGFRFILENEL